MTTNSNELLPSSSAERQMEVPTGTAGNQAAPGSPGHGQIALPEILPPFDYGTVPDVADELRAAAIQIRHRSAKCLVDNGRDLIKWRDLLPHGRFRSWVATECGFSVRLAELAMMVAEYVDACGECENFSHLPLSHQYLVASPSTPQSVRDQVIGSFAAGRPMKIQDVKKMVRAAKGETGDPKASTLDQANAPAFEEGPEAETASSEDRECAPHAAGTLSEEPAKCEPEGVLRIVGATTIGSGGEAQSSYLDRVVDLLAKEVRSKGLLINLLDRAGYDHLARALSAHEDAQLRKVA